MPDESPPNIQKSGPNTNIVSSVGHNTVAHPIEHVATEHFWQWYVRSRLNINPSDDEL